MPDGRGLPELADVRIAHERIRPHIHCTPVLTSSRIDAAADAKLLFKCENFQKTGVFKVRGAFNAVLALSDAEAARGILTHSSGNHGAAIALAARTRSVPAHIVVPRNALVSKIENIQRNDGRIIFCEPTPADRARTVERVQQETGAVLIHPYDDAMIIAGQGTAALELIESHPEIEVLVAPVGGGGLLGGSALVAKTLLPAVQVLGAEPEAADDAARSLRAGSLIPQTDPRTMADGLRTSLGDRNFALIRQHVDGIVTVSESAIVAAMRLAWSVLKIVIEPSSAVALAAVLAAPDAVRGKRVGVILSGGNVDLDSLPWSG